MLMADGSSYYTIHHNFCVYGGHKADFDGHSKISSNNLHVYPSVYGSKCVGMLQRDPPEGYAEGYVNNICILPQRASQYLLLNINDRTGACDGSNTSIELFQTGFIATNNTVYVPGGEATVQCNHVNINASSFMSGSKNQVWNNSAGYDTTSRVSGDMPSVDTIVGWAKSLLNM